MEHFCFPLNNGHRIPALGLAITDDIFHDEDFGIPLAVSEGYRLFDLTDPALDYRRIGRVLGHLLRERAIPRDQFYFIVNYDNSAYEHWRHDSDRISGIMQDLQIEYADLMVIEKSPNWLDDGAEQDKHYRLPRCDRIRRAIENMRNEKLSERVVSIGFNHFNLLQIRKTMDRYDFVPNVVKIDVSPYFQEKEARDFCRHHGIAVIGQPSQAPRQIPDDDRRLVQIPPVLCNPKIRKIAHEHIRREGEIIHRWYIDERMTIVTKMGGLKKLQVLSELCDFELSDEQLAMFRSLDVQKYSKPYEIIQNFRAGKIRIPVLATRNNKTQIPQLGITLRHNVKCLPRPDFRKGLHLALDAGIRHIDTAQKHQKLQKIVGQTLAEYIKDGRFERKDVFLVSKVWQTFHSFDRCQQAVKQCLEELKTDYIDLMCIHYPQGTLVDDWNPELDRGDSRHDYLETYKSLEKCVHDGTVRAIGLCNFSVKQIKRVVENSSIKPAVVQAEYAVTYKRHADTVRYCHANGIVFVTGWPFGQENDNPHHKSSNKGVDDTVEMLALARELGKTRRQIALAWCVAKGCVVLPRSFSQHEIAEYIDSFSIRFTKKQMEFLDGLEDSYPTWNDGVVDLHHPYWHLKDE